MCFSLSFLLVVLCGLCGGVCFFRFVVFSCFWLCPGFFFLVFLLFLFRGLFLPGPSSRSRCLFLVRCVVCGFLFSVDVVVLFRVLCPVVVVLPGGLPVSRLSLIVRVCSRVMSLCLLGFFVFCSVFFCFSVSLVFFCCVSHCCTFIPSCVSYIFLWGEGVSCLLF